MLNQLVATYVASHPNSSIVLPRLWRTCAAVVLNAMITLYEADSTTIRRTLEVCQVWKCIVMVSCWCPVHDARVSLYPMRVEEHSSPYWSCMLVSANVKATIMI